MTKKQKLGRPKAPIPCEVNLRISVSHKFRRQLKRAAKRAKESVRQFCLRAIQREIEKDGK